MSTCSDLQYLLEDFGDYEFDEEEYIRNWFKDPGADLCFSVEETKKSGPTEKIGKKNNAYTKQIIPPDDIRRTYPKLFESAWNNYDKDQLHDFFHGIASKELLTIIAYPNGNPHGPSYREIHGPQATTEYYFTYLTSVPDSLVFIHETKFIIKQNGNINIVCKFTLTGSRLYLIKMTGEEKQQSPLSPKHHKTIKLEPVPNAQAPSSSTSSCGSNGSPRRMHQAKRHINSHSVSSSSASGAKTSNASEDPGLDLDEYLDCYNAVKQNIVFKDSYTVKNKHDKYRRLNHSTMGEYVDFSRLADPSLIDPKNPSPTSSGSSSSSSSSSAVKQDNTLNSGQQQNFSLTGIKRSNSSDSNNNDNNSSSSRTCKMTAIDRARNQCSGDVLVSASDAKFSLSPILPTAVRSNIFGILRFHVQADKKVNRLEFMCAFRENDNEVVAPRASATTTAAATATV